MKNVETKWRTTTQGEFLRIVEHKRNAGPLPSMYDMEELAAALKERK
jgi:hypothetical protein